VLIDRDRNRKPARRKIDFEARVRKVHGDKYDYSQAVYVSTDVSVIINCPTHGAFEQKPAIHMQGHGCQQCGTDRIRLIQTTGRLKKARGLAFSDAEYEKLGELAKAAKLSRSEYIIERLGLDK
jgi:ferredoxin-like protein FixX